ncbi:MAG: phosphoribosyltransferase [Rhodothermales bacterium]
MLSRARFAGPVRNTEYIIVDDVVTQGGTVSALRRYVEARGGRVVAVSSLGVSSSPQVGYGGHVAIRPETLTALYEKFGQQQLNTLLAEEGIATRAGQLTNSEGRYLLSFAGLDSLRNRIAEGRDAARSKGRPGPSGEETPGESRKGLFHVGSHEEQLRQALRQNLEVAQRLRQAQRALPEGLFKAIIDARLYGGDIQEVLQSIPTEHQAAATAYVQVAGEAARVDEEVFGAASGATTVDALEKVLRPIYTHWRKRGGSPPPVTLIQRESDLPAHLQNKIRADGAEGEVRAVYDPPSQQVYLIADNMPGDPASMVRSLPYPHERGGEPFVKFSQSAEIVVKRIHRSRGD